MQVFFTGMPGAVPLRAALFSCPKPQVDDAVRGDMSGLEGPTAHTGVTLIVGAAQFALTWTDLRQMRTTGVARDRKLDALDRRY